MLRSILLGLDGSAYSNAAIELGIRWARRFGARLVGLGVIDSPTICKREAVPMGAGHFKVERDQELLADARRRVDEFLGGFVRRCETEGVRHHVVEYSGMPDAQIVEQSKLYDLTMLGQQTYFHFETQDWPDETLRRVLRNCPRPVVTVPEALVEGRCAVVAYDGGVQADRALQAFQASGLADEGEVHVVSIQTDLAAAAQVAGQAADFLKLHGVNAVPRPLERTMSEDRVILSQVRELEAHLLVMGAYGRSMWREWMFGSTTTGVMGSSPVPLFLCH